MPKVLIHLFKALGQMGEWIPDHCPSFPLHPSSLLLDVEGSSVSADL